MKKKILGLALALVMIISLLPLTALAEDTPRPMVRMFDPTYSGSNGYLEIDSFEEGKTEYVIFEAVTDGTTEIGNKPVLVTNGSIPTQNYVKYTYSSGVLTITLNSVNYKRSAKVSYNNPFIRVLNSENYTANFSVVLNFEGANTLEGYNTIFDMQHEGSYTVAGSGSLTANVSLDADYVFRSTKTGLLVQNATLDLTINNSGATSIGIIAANGAITFENATLRANANQGTKVKSYGIVTGEKYSALADSTKGISFVNCPEVNIENGNYESLYTNGPISIENSSVQVQKNTANYREFASSMPTLVGTHSSVQVMKFEGATNTFKDWDGSIAAGTPLTQADALIGFKTVHTHTAAAADDGDCKTAVKCACGKDFLPAQTAHIAGANADDCTKDTICGNPGCTQVFEAATATAHTPKADDGDCTTDILCANTGCTQVVTKGAEKHKDTRTDCAVAGTCANTGCTHTFAAGQHTGGTATCKDKAKCDICGQGYGELAACTPAADDGDCTTAVKCSVCGKETTAAQAAHKYTDKADTTCDNTGCTNTRKVEGTENPKTGDNTALVLCLSLMMVASAAFVCTKKYVR